MFRAVSQYAREEVLPRYKRIALGGHFILAFFLAVLVAARGEVVFATGPKVGEVVPVILTYAAIALGFCVAGLTVALTIPDREFAYKLAKKTLRPRSPTQNAYSDLLFVFSWTALAHWTTIAASVAALLASRGQAVILPYGASVLNRVFVGIVVFLSSYGFFQFLITLITLSQVGRVYIQSLGDRDGP